MIQLRYTLPFPPSSNRYWRTTRNGIMYVSAEAKDYQHEVRAIVGDDRPELSGELRLEVELFAPDRRRWDVSNRVKILEDALQHCGVLADDRFVDDLRARRHPPQKPGRAEVCITQLRTPQQVLFEAEQAKPKRRRKAVA